MSIIRKFTFIIIVLVTSIIVVFIAGCGISGSTSSNVSEVNEGESETKVEGGKIYDTQEFSILWPDLWDEIDITDGVMVYTKDFSVVVTVSGSDVIESGDKALLEDIAKQNNGTPLEEVSMFGVKLYKTSFIADDKDQTVYSGAWNGQQVKIELTGEDHQNNEIIKAVLESIKLR